ncbi:phosphoribosylglycinamide formyltransferase [Sphingosinicella sp. CPCC 101087]|uniref:phosphoribosylglycinamide formyltransferase n=1 Tax=Sphingosinicella sp. CPCC 101087 TaxID=2497754 RepID=UPI00101C54F6|nr:phosphoribosylglycinamide formyltransferase [Sphingosinicella sp. CPCC 101087]
MADKVRVAVLISGRGSNLLALAEHKRRDPDRPYEIVLVASNVPEARGVVLAKRLGLRTWSLSHKGMERRLFDQKLDTVLREHDVELIALAGYMRLLSPEFVERWEGRILNIHPSLLPLHKGLDTHRRALLAGDEYAGCSVHVVTADLDSGPVIAQTRVRILPRDDADSLAARVLEAEHELYPAALERYAHELRGAIGEGREGGSDD